MKVAELTAAIPKIRVVDANTGRVCEGYYCEMPETTYCMSGPPIKTVRMILTYEMTDWGLPNTPKLYRIDDEDDIEIIPAEPPNEEQFGKTEQLKQEYYHAFCSRCGRPVIAKKEEAFWWPGGTTDDHLCISCDVCGGLAEV